VYYFALQAFVCSQQSSFILYIIKKPTLLECRLSRFSLRCSSCTWVHWYYISC